MKYLPRLLREIAIVVLFMAVAYLLVRAGHDAGAAVVAFACTVYVLAGGEE